MLTKLKTNFMGRGEVKGFAFKLELETPLAYMYEVNTGDGIHYEVFKKKTCKVCLDFANRVYSDDDMEVYPKRNAFGVTAWTMLEYDRAIERLDLISIPKVDKDEV